MKVATIEAIISVKFEDNGKDDAMDQALAQFHGDLQLFNETELVHADVANVEELK